MKKIDLPKEFANWWNLHRKLKACHSDDIEEFCKALLEFNRKHPGEMRIISEIPMKQPHVTPRIRLASKEEFYHYSRRVSQRLFREGLLAELDLEEAVKEGRHLRLLKGGAGNAK
jgi:hypothetical protein